MYLDICIYCMFDILNQVIAAFCFLILHFHVYYFREEDLLEEAEPFCFNAFMIITEMVSRNREVNETQQRDATILVDEVLHSIFVLGKIHTPPFSPEEILSDAEILSAFRIQYPRPFALYSSELPRRSPFSCVLDMVVEQKGRDNEREIREELQELVGRLVKSGTIRPLVSKALSVSQSESNGPVRYYGVSMSAYDEAKTILIGASCLSSWDRYVADAVMTFYPEQSDNSLDPYDWPFVRKPYFDGTFRVPEQVWCQTFDLYNGRIMDPCFSCHQLFGLTTTRERVFSHGNCSEAESLSNLFQGDAAVRAQIQRPPGGDRARAETSVRDALRCFVQDFDGFTEWEARFYTPQEVRF
ncbi:uncharacterized protein LOC117949509 [Etheostoma cragini]|uniref:uncharacterized protein LOC117949509 n=1 Tax=Etheostoma cragini TaxID=417921 RepID=UPI00155EE12B|nr:uncharacterized protein LOC117949509 [Etheostoma cragini]